MYDFQSNHKTPTKDSIFRGHGIIILTLLLTGIVLLSDYVNFDFTIPKPSTTTVIRTLSPVTIPELPKLPEIQSVQIIDNPKPVRIQHNEIQEEVIDDTPEWINNFSSVFGTMGREIGLLIHDIISIPERHFEDVAKNHHYPGILPTMNTDGDIIQKTPCKQVNLIFPDGRVTETCISETIYHK